MAVRARRAGEVRSHVSSSILIRRGVITMAEKSARKQEIEKVFPSRELTPFEEMERFMDELAKSPEANFRAPSRCLRM
jgi:hypothetical protein